MISAVGEGSVPFCFGSVKQYSKNNNICGACPYRVSCSVVVNKKLED